MPLFPLSSIFLRLIGFCGSYLANVPIFATSLRKNTHVRKRVITARTGVFHVSLALRLGIHRDVNVFRYAPESLRSAVTVLTSQQNLICRGKAPSNGFPLRFTPRVSSKTTLGSSVTLARSAESLLLQFRVAGTD